MSDRKVLKFITPRGIAVYPKLTTPDTKFKAQGEYSVKLRLEADAFDDALLEKLAAIRDGFVEETKQALIDKKQGAKAKSLKVRDILAEETDKETGEPTGKLLFKAKMVASGVSKKDGRLWTRKPTIFDSKGKKLDPLPQIWGGSELKIAVEAVPYYTPKDNEVGLAFYLSAVQVLKLVAGGGESASDFGFGEEEGFTSEDAEASQFSDETAEAGTDF